MTDEGDERLVQVFRSSELTFVIIDTRVVQHTGSAVRDEDYEAYRLVDVADLEFESGSVATMVILTIDDRQKRFKIPDEQARPVREELTQVLRDYHGIGSLEEFHVQMEQVQAAAEDTDAKRDSTDFGAGPDPLSANPDELSDESANAALSGGAAPAEPTRQAARNQSTGSAEVAIATGTVAEAKMIKTATAQSTVESPAAEQSPGSVAGVDSLRSEGSGLESAAESEASDTVIADADCVTLAAKVESLHEVVEARSEQIRHQQRPVEQLIEELRYGR